MNTDITPDSPRTEGTSTLHLCTTRDPRRAEFEDFVAGGYRKCYGAELHHFLPLLLGVGKGHDAGVSAVVGMNPDARARFLDVYLDRPADLLLEERIGRPSQGTCEIGNLYSASPGCGRISVGAMASYLVGRQIDWAIFTGTRPLRVAFQRMVIELVDIGAANPERLPDTGARWGSYYETQPRVVAAFVPQVRALLRDRLVDEQELLDEALRAGRRAAVLRATLNTAVSA